MEVYNNPNVKGEPIGVVFISVGYGSSHCNFHIRIFVGSTIGMLINSEYNTSFLDKMAGEGIILVS